MKTVVKIVGDTDYKSEAELNQHLPYKATERYWQSRQVWVRGHEHRSPYCKDATHVHAERTAESSGQVRTSQGLPTSRLVTSNATYTVQTE
jgi:hypothetical protein